MVSIEKVSKVIFGSFSAVALSMALAGCSDGSSAQMPPKPTDKTCSNWQYDQSLGVWQCKDSKSSYYNHYYHGGNYYATKEALTSSSSYKSYKTSSSFAGEGASHSSGESVSAGHEGGFGGHAGGGE